MNDWIVTVRYASKPWDRGREPLTREVAVPGNYVEHQIESWLCEKRLLNAGEKVVSFYRRKP